MIKKKFYVLLISLSMLLCVIVAFFVRKSIYIYTFDQIVKDASKLSFVPYEDVLFSNGTFDEVTDTYNVIQASVLIIEGKVTNNRQVLKGAIKTEIEIMKVMKGQINQSTLQVYEPINISMRASYISTYDGYNMLKEGKSYYLCLSNVVDGVYMFTTPMLAKFPVTYEEADFQIISSDVFTQQKTYYNKYMDYEQLFSSEVTYKKYNETYEELVELSKE